MPLDSVTSRRGVGSRFLRGPGYPPQFNELVGGTPSPQPASFTGTKRYSNRVAESSTSTGIGNFTPGGALDAASRTFASVYTLSNVQHFDYAIDGLDGTGNYTGEWEEGHGYWNGSAIVRGTIADSSNNGSIVNFSAGNKQIYVTTPAAVFNKLANFVFAQADYGATGNGVSDDTAAIMAMLADVDPDRGTIVCFEPGVYLVSNGITEAKRGLVVQGLGSISNGPGIINSGAGTAGNVGAVLKATLPGAYVWTHDSSGFGNDYAGARFENLGFWGNSVTGGGLRLRCNYNYVRRCWAGGSLTGIGFSSQLRAPGDDASWNMFDHCLEQDDLVGYQAGTANLLGTGSAASAQFNQCINIKTSITGLAHTGYGCVIYDNNSHVQGGKYESNSIGILVKCDPGTSILTPHCEDNSTYDIELDRGYGSSGTRNIVIAATSKIHVGSFQANDVIVCNGFDATGVVDNGTDTIIIGGPTQVVKLQHYGSSTPPGEFSGSLKAGNQRLNLNDRGSWIIIPAAGLHAVLQSTPSDPTGTTSTTGVMMGLAGSITPAATGRIKITINGNLTNTTATAGDGAKAQIRWGTGSAPANAAALTGTTAGSLVSSVLERAVASDLQPFSLNAIVTGLTLGTAVWVDIGLAAIVGGTAQAKNISVTAHEL